MHHAGWLNVWWRLCLALGLAMLAQATGATALWVGTGPRAGAVPLDGAQLVCSDDADPLERFVCDDLAADFGRVGLTLSVGRNAARPAPLQIWFGRPGHHAAIDALAAQGRIDLRPLANCWECFHLELVPHAAPGVPWALVVAGADRRGAAYGAYTLSQALGVSPWHWWADVAPLRRPGLRLALPAPQREGPAVRYRGLFINDEDWGLFPWAARTYEPEAGTLGPRTYEQVFRLLLRLKANTLWPAMHKVSGAFNARPENAALAARYGIVMGSSHAEPLLRNNVAEWSAPPGQYNYATHPEAVRDYWAERLRRNGTYENLYTLGMRGIHDSAMQGAATLEERRVLLERVITDQRELLRQHVGDPATVPQVFVPYKEVLELMTTPPGLAVPDDVTLVWPDDNFGYLRRLPQPGERGRGGGHGVYTHLSYLGAPLSYLWLSTTPPALMNEELGRAFEAGATRLWVANGGDIKPAEVNLSHFFDLAWNPPAVRAQGQAGYLRELAARLFGDALAPGVAALWDGAYRLNFERRPEHLQFYLHGEAPRASGWTPARVMARLAAFHALLRQLDALQPRVAAAQLDGFFQLVEYPLRAAALANERYFALEAAAQGMPALRAHRADLRLKALTARYNAGRWAGILAEEPADAQWPRFRLRRSDLPALAPEQRAALRGEALADLARATADTRPVSTAPAEAGVPLQVEADANWLRVAGLGRGEGVLRARQEGAALRLQAAAAPGPACLWAHVLPNYPGDGRSPWRLTLLEAADGAGRTIELDRVAQDAAWAAGVLDNRLSVRWPVEAGSNGWQAELRSEAAGLLFDGAELHPGPCPG